MSQHAQAAPAAASTPVFALERTFSAPIETVFAAWTNAEMLARWFGPVGMTVGSLTAEFIPGGQCHFSLDSERGPEMWALWKIREVTPPERLVFVQAFSNPQGHIVRAPFTELWPLETLTTLTFTASGRETQFRLESVPLTDDVRELETFAQTISSMHQGWGGTLDRLDAQLVA